MLISALGDCLQGALTLTGSRNRRESSFNLQKPQSAFCAALSAIVQEQYVVGGGTGDYIFSHLPPPAKFRLFS